MKKSTKKRKTIRKKKRKEHLKSLNKGVAVKKVYNTKPKLRQKLAFAKVVENHGNVSKAMIEAGYSPATAVNPSNLTESKGWKELMDEYIPDSLLAQKHKELLTVPRKRRISVKDELVEETEELDSNAVKAGLDMAYKLKGAYKEDNEQKRPTVILNIEKQKEIEKALDDI